MNHHLGLYDLFLILCIIMLITYLIMVALSKYLEFQLPTYFHYGILTWGLFAMFLIGMIYFDIRICRQQRGDNLQLG